MRKWGWFRTFGPTLLPASSRSFRVQRSHLGVVPREHFLCYGCNKLQQELLPFLFKVDLVHVDVDGGDVLIAPLDSGVLGNKPIQMYHWGTVNTSSYVHSEPHWCRLCNVKDEHTHATAYHISPSWPLAKVFHFFNEMVTGHISEHWEPVNIWTWLERRQKRSSPGQRVISVWWVLCGIWLQVASHIFYQFVLNHAGVVLVDVTFLPVLKHTETDHTPISSTLSVRPSIQAVHPGRPSLPEDFQRSATDHCEDVLSCTSLSTECGQMCVSCLRT